MLLVNGEGLLHACISSSIYTLYPYFEAEDSLTQVGRIVTESLIDF